MLLEGLKVVEMSTWVAGPGCAAIMADWGADVIKVESAAGDPVRFMFPDLPDSPGNPVFSLENRGKRGLVLDITKAEGRQALMALLKTADVFITNVRPGALARAGLDYASVHAAAPQLIYASITGYGLQGEEADRPAFDLTGFWTRTGIAAATIPPDQEPFPCRPGFGDHVTALATCAAVLAAVHGRVGDGQGQLVETSLMRAGAYVIGWDLSQQLKYGEAVTAQPRHDRPAAASGFFRTADDRWFMVSPRGPTCFPSILTLTGLGHLIGDPRFTPPIADLERVRELRAMLDEVFAGMTLEEVGRRLSAADLIWAPMASLAEMANDPQARAAGVVVQTPDGAGGSFAAPATPARFPGAEHGPRSAYPGLGEHTRQVLAEAGLTAVQVERLIAAGVAVQGVG